MMMNKTPWACCIGKCARQAGLIMHMADQARAACGGALAVDRDAFAQAVTKRLLAHPNIQLARDEDHRSLPEDGHWIIATGPLTSDALGQAIAQETGAEALAFFDAIAPIVYFDSIDMSKAWFQSRYDKGETEEERKAYLNCPMTATSMKPSSTRCWPLTRPSSMRAKPRAISTAACRSR
jgi:tRNA:m(5)U-54 methyltransferase